VDKENTTYRRRRGQLSDIQGRVNQIRRQIEETTDDYDREKLQERLAKLAGGGGRHQRRRCDRDRDEGKEARVEDALHADPRGGRGKHVAARCGVAALPARHRRQGCERRRKDWRGHREARD